MVSGSASSVMSGCAAVDGGGGREAESDAEPVHEARSVGLRRRTRHSNGDKVRRVAGGCIVAAAAGDHPGGEGVVHRAVSVTVDIDVRRYCPIYRCLSISIFVDMMGACRKP